MDPKEESPIPPPQLWPELHKKLDLFNAEGTLRETSLNQMIPLDQVLNDLPKNE